MGVFAMPGPKGRPSTVDSVDTTQHTCWALTTGKPCQRLTGTVGLLCARSPTKEIDREFSTDPIGNLTVIPEK